MCLGQNSPQKSSLWKYNAAAYGSYQLATRSQTPSVKDDDNSIESPFKQDEVYMPFRNVFLVTAQQLLIPFAFHVNILKFRR